MEINFILVEPKVPENIGASARALKTMGFTSLSLVKPCDDPEDRARWLAHGSLEILDNAVTFNTLSEALKDSDMAIATTVRHRSIQKDQISSSYLTDFISERCSGLKKVSIVFGREESGLSTSEMKLCDVTSTIPMQVKFPSLNLAQSVMVFSYELSSLIKQTSADIESNKETNSESLKTLKLKISEILELTEIADNKNLSGRIMERLSFIGSKDLNLFHSISGSILSLLKRRGK